MTARPGASSSRRSPHRSTPSGTVTIIPDGTIHVVEALDDQEAVSLHIYGTDIATQPRSTFDLATGIETPFSPPLSDPHHD